MSFSFNSLDHDLYEYRGKMVKIVFTNGKVGVYEFIGITSGINNGDGIATLEVEHDKINDAILSIEENEIASLEIMESIPNDDTTEALDEIKRMKENPSEYKGYDDTDKMIECIRKILSNEGIRKEHVLLQQKAAMAEDTDSYLKIM